MFSGPPHAESLREELDRGWYALYTRSRHEKAVARALTAKGLQGFPSALRSSPSMERQD
jgi:hypothetical protein